MVIPAADVGECDLHAQVRFDELRELAQAIAEAALGIVRSGRGLVFIRVGGLEHLDRVESFLTGAVQHGIHGLVIHRFESIGDGRAIRAAAADAEIVDVVHGHGGLAAGKHARQRWSHGDGAEGRIRRRLGQAAQSAIQPAVFSGFDAGRAGLHEILRVEMGAGGIGRSGSVHNRQMTLLPKRLE